jgi:zinc transporter ZupT
MLIEGFKALHPITQALCGTLFTWFLTALGAGLVFFFKKINQMKPILPYALAFAAGAMIYVVVEELIPEARQEMHSDFATVGAMLGFAVMMTLDVALG